MREEIIKMAREAGFDVSFDIWAVSVDGVHITKELECFFHMAQAAEREAISNEWWMCIQSDLEHGVKALSQKAAEDFYRYYPELSKFGGWLEARGQA